MKKNGFTLAEVLITLAIIGVVATLTLPALMSNTAEQQAMTAYKKILNSLNEAAQMNAAIDGFDYSVPLGNHGDTIIEGYQTLWALFTERLQVSLKASSPYGDGGTRGTEGDNQCGEGSVIVLRDGTALCISDDDSDDNYNYWNIYVDTNGPKGPNKLSSCSEEGCTTRTNRMIKDQYPVTLSRGIAVPGHWESYEHESNNDADYAARFAMGIGRNNSSGS